MAKIATFVLTNGSDEKFSARTVKFGYDLHKTETIITEALTGKMKDNFVHQTLSILKYNNVSVVDYIQLPYYYDETPIHTEDYLIVAAENAFLMLNDFAFTSAGGKGDYKKMVYSKRDDYYKLLNYASIYPFHTEQLDDKDDELYQKYRELIKIYRYRMLKADPSDMQDDYMLLNALFYLRQKDLGPRCVTETDYFIKKYKGKLGN